MINPLPVLIVGGGLAGLSSALLLASQGIKTILVEKHAGSSPLPRATGFTQRSLEIFRSVGIENEIKNESAIKNENAAKNIANISNQRPRRTKVESLAGVWQEETPWTPPSDSKPSLPQEYSPCSGVAIAQDKLEPILYKHAQSLGADIRFNTRLINFTQDGTCVTARVKNADGEEYEIKAAYLIAADGHRSPVREALNIGRTGVGKMKTLRSVLFRADLEKYLEKGISQFEISQPDFNAFLTTYRDGRWVLMFEDDIERDKATLEKLITQAIGRNDIAFEIITTGRWELSAFIADKFSDGRVFLAGDAAHTLPPSRGGYGANTGIEDAHNLCWKLAAVLTNKASPELLNSYDQERRSIAWLRHNQIFARPDYSQFANRSEPTTIIEDDAMEFGQRYSSAAIADANENLPAALTPSQWAGQPGTRAPHAWIMRNGEKISTLDLFGKGWVLLTQNVDWKKSVHEYQKKTPPKTNEIELITHCLHEDFSSENQTTFSTLFGLSDNGALLVRPDGYIAWRTQKKPEDDLDALFKSLQTILGDN